MQQYADIYLLQNYSTCFGCHTTRNMYSSFAVNKYLHTVASVGFLFTLYIVVFIFLDIKQEDKRFWTEW